MSLHTPGKIVFRPNGDANSYAMLDEASHWWMSLLMNGEQITARQEANLRRMAACWNACVEIPTERLEEAAADPISGMFGRMAAVTSHENARLVSVLSTLLDVLDDPRRTATQTHEALEAAREAVSITKGVQP